MADFNKILTWALKVADVILRDCKVLVNPPLALPIRNADLTAIVQIARGTILAAVSAL